MINSVRKLVIPFPTFGGKTPETKLSMRELIGKMHDVMGRINSLVGRHAAVTDPLQRAEIERQIAEKLFFLQDFTAKFGKAFLDRVNRNALYAGKLISNMDIRSLLSRYPDPITSLKNYKKTSENSLDQFAKEAREDMERWYGLRRYAGNIKNRVKSNILAAMKAIGKKITSAQKQQLAKSKKQEQAAKQQLELKDLRTTGDVKRLKITETPTEEEKRRRLEQWKRMEALRRAGALGEREKARR